MSLGFTYARTAPRCDPGIGKVAAIALCDWRCFIGRCSILVLLRWRCFRILSDVI